MKGIVLGILLVALGAPLGATAPVDCGFSGQGGDSLAHGIVVPGYTGTNVRSVELAFAANSAGVYGVRLTIHRGAFDGPPVGTPVTEYLTLDAGAPTLYRAFDFGGAPVTPGDTLALSLEQVQGAGALSFDTGSGSCVFGQAYATADQTPPLGSHSGNAGISIVADDLITACVPSDTLACLDDAPGDHRFAVTAHYSTAQSGGLSGDGQAVALSALGIDNGALFWFFGPRNPEVLVKVLDGCSLNHELWVFYSANTNAGFTLTVRDNLTGAQKTYSNSDLHPASPVEDTSALPCPGPGPS